MGWSGHIAVPWISGPVGAALRALRCERCAASAASAAMRALPSASRSTTGARQDRPPQGGQDAIAPSTYDRARFARRVMPGWRRTPPTAGGRAILAAAQPNASPRETRRAPCPLPPWRSATPRSQRAVAASAERQHVAARNRIQPVARGLFVHAATGEAREGRKHTTRRAEHERRQP